MVSAAHNAPRARETMSSRTPLTSQFPGSQSTHTSLEVEKLRYGLEKDEKVIRDSLDYIKSESSPCEKDRQLSEEMNEGRAPTLVGQAENDLPRATTDIDLEAKSPNNGVAEDHAGDGAFPEGGRGWLVLFGSYLLAASSFGLVRAFSLREDS
ncbi:hypothetical protein FRB95_005828 [Tulasnella sp. JGI-2019a]|nr:hypothetical protein FRB95_005828 [Tulasnella sp. JGI-2019a]